MKKSKLITIAVLLTVFCVVAFLGLSGRISDFENFLPVVFNPQKNKSEFFYSFTVLGDTLLDVVIICAFVLLPVTRKRVGIPIASTAVSSVIINSLIKNIVERRRPPERLLEVSGFSFPSGHAMNNMAIYLMLFFCLLPLCKSKPQKITTFSVFIIFPIVMGISRIYFNVHYFSDVVCGWCLGAIIAICFSEIFKEGIKNE